VKLLVVEEEPRMLEVLHCGLGEEGYDVACATNGSKMGTSPRI
jgi:DNA-binding response OmpR family regulator